MITMVILLILLILFVIIGVPLAFAIGASCITYLLFTNPNLLLMVPQKLWTGSYSDLMIAMPLFMLAGDIMRWDTGIGTASLLPYHSSSERRSPTLQKMHASMQKHWKKKNPSGFTQKDSTAVDWT